MRSLYGRVALSITQGGMALRFNDSTYSTAFIRSVPDLLKAFTRWVEADRHTHFKQVIIFRCALP